MPKYDPTTGAMKMEVGRQKKGAIALIVAFGLWASGIYLTLKDIMSSPRDPRRWWIVFLSLVGAVTLGLLGIAITKVAIAAIVTSVTLIILDYKLYRNPPSVYGIANLLLSILGLRIRI